MTVISRKNELLSTSGVTSWMNVAGAKTSANDGTNDYSSSLVEHAHQTFEMTNVSGTAVGISGAGTRVNVSAAFGSLYNAGSTFTVKRNGRTLEIHTGAYVLKFRD